MSLGNPEISKVGHELDGKLAELLMTLGVDVPPALKFMPTTAGERFQ